MTVARSASDTRGRDRGRSWRGSTLFIVDAFTKVAIKGVTGGRHCVCHFLLVATVYCNPHDLLATLTLAKVMEPYAMLNRPRMDVTLDLPPGRRRRPQAEGRMLRWHLEPRGAPRTMCTAAALNRPLPTTVAWPLPPVRNQGRALEGSASWTSQARRKPIGPGSWM